MTQQKKRYTYEQWQVMRERFRIASFEQPSPDMQITDMRKIVSGLMKKIGMEQELWLNTLEDEWESIVGSAVAAHTRPGRFENSQLTIYVDNAVWLFELKQQKSIRSILVNLAKRYGKNRIKKIFPVPDPDR